MIRQTSAIRLALYLLATAGLLALAVSPGVRPGYGSSPSEAPARTVLVNARQHLSMSLSHERQLVDQADADHYRLAKTIPTTPGAHEELAKTLELLAKARYDDPSIRAQVDRLRAQLAKLGNDARMEHMAPRALNRAYRALGARIDALIRAS